MTLYRQLNIDINMADWWRACKGKPILLKKCRILISLITGGLSLNAQKGHYRVNTRLCQLCDTFEVETVTHFLFACTGLDRDRHILMQRLLAAMPQAMQDSFNRTNEKTVFMLGTLGASYIPEWQAIYEAAINLVAGLYAARSEHLAAL